MPSPTMRAATVNTPTMRPSVGRFGWGTFDEIEAAQAPQTFDDVETAVAGLTFDQAEAQLAPVERAATMTGGD